VSPQVDNARYVGFVNKVSDPAARLLTSRYSHEQLAYFGALVSVLRCSLDVVLSSILLQYNDRSAITIKSVRYKQPAASYGDPMSTISTTANALMMDVCLQVESIATASCRDGEDGKPCLPSEDAASLRYDPPQTQEPAQPTQVPPGS